MHPSLRFPRRTAVGLAAFGLVAAVLAPGLALAQAEQRTFFDTGYTIVDDAIWSFFDQYGGSATFGEPISREFSLMGTPVQLFQDAALQVQPDGSVQPLPLTSKLLPGTSFDGLTVPAADAATAFVAPAPDQTNYAARLQVFLQTVIPNTFSSTFNSTGGTAVWGLPTSAPRADPNNPSFIYQRFQNGILFYDATAGTTRALPVGEYLKQALTAKPSPAGGVVSDLTAAFTPDAG